MRPPMGSRLVSWKPPPHQHSFEAKRKRSVPRVDLSFITYAGKVRGLTTGSGALAFHCVFSPRGVGFFPLTTRRREKVRRVDLRCNGYVGGYAASVPATILVAGPALFIAHSSPWVTLSCRQMEGGR